MLTALIFLSLLSLTVMLGIDQHRFARKIIANYQTRGQAFLLAETNFHSAKTNIPTKPGKYLINVTGQYRHITVTIKTEFQRQKTGKLIQLWWWSDY